MFIILPRYKRHAHLPKRWAMSNTNKNFKPGGGCGRAVAFNTPGPRFESKFYRTIIQWQMMKKIKIKREAENSLLWKTRILSSWLFNFVALNKHNCSCLAWTLIIAPCSYHADGKVITCSNVKSCHGKPIIKILASHAMFIIIIINYIFLLTSVTRGWSNTNIRYDTRP